MSAPAALTARALRARLEAAAAGLVYSSESDRPFEFVVVPAPGVAPGTALDPAAFAALVGATAAGPAERRALHRFLARHLDLADPLDLAAQRLRPRYEALEAALRDSLGIDAVYRVGRVEVACYAVGWTADGRLAGLRTVAVET